MSAILLISPEPWDGHFVSKHHYALELARRGHDVVFHGPPDAAGGMRLVAVAETHGRLQVLRAPRVAAGLRYMPGPLRRLLEARWLAKVEKISGQYIDVVWSFENSRFFDMGFAGERLKIYQQVDLNQDFHPAQAAATADMAIAISAPIEKLLAPVAQNLLRITHGNAEQSATDSYAAPLDQCFASATVNAVLVGNLDIAYLDVPLLAQLVMAHPDVQFHFVGTYRPGHGLHAAVGKVPNVFFWGRQPSDALPDFLSRADILLVTYLADAHLEQLANPHKIMQYLACGRCILATRTLEYENRPDLLEVAADRQDYARRFASIAANPAAWNSPEQKALRRAFALENSYPRQLDRIAQALGRRGSLIS